MADLNYTVNTGQVTLPATNPRSMITLTAPTNQRVKIKGLSVFGQGIVNTDTPLKVELLTYASLTGGMAGTVTTSKRDTENGETVQSTIAGNYNNVGSAAEPTYTTPIVVEVWDVHPQTGLAVFFPLGEEIKLKGGTGVAVRVTPNQSEPVSVNLYVEE